MRLFVAGLSAMLPWVAVAQGTAVVRHGPTLGSSVAVDGSIHLLSAESVVLAGAGIANDLLVPGTPRVSRVSTIKVGSIIVGSGASTPSGYSIWTGGSGRIGRLIANTDPVDFPLVFAPQAPIATRSVVVTTAGQEVGLWATLKDLSIAADCGDYTIPSGTYGAFSVSGGSSLTLGTAGAVTPDVYEFQTLTLDGTGAIHVLGPVVINVGGSLVVEGEVGSPSNPDWVRLTLSSGNFLVGGAGTFTGTVIIPSGTATIEGAGRISGGLFCDRLVMRDAGVLSLAKGGSTNLPPVAQSKVLELAAGESLSVTVGGSDPEGGAVAFRWLDTPSKGTLSVIGSNGSSQTVKYGAGDSAGEEVLRFAVIDNKGASAVGTLTTRIIGTDGTFGRCAGLVREATSLEPMPGVTIHVVDAAFTATTGADGSYSVVFDGFGDFATRYATVEFSAPGYLSTYRKLAVHRGCANPVEPVFLKKMDEKVTVIGAGGGTATSAAGDVVAEIPAGATSQTISVQLTNYNAIHELPGFLPTSSAFTYAVDLKPEGAAFSQPVTVKVANILGFAAGTPIPVGLFNPETVRWEHESMGTISADGNWVVFQVTHFSTRDCNVPPARGNPSPVPPPPEPKKLPCDQARDPGVGIADGTYETELELPALQVLNGAFAPKLVYRSEHASGRQLLPFKGADESNVRSPDAHEIQIQVGTVAAQATYKGQPQSVYGAYHLAQSIDLSSLPTGLYRVRAEISNNYAATTYGTSTVFGGSPVGDTGVPLRGVDKRAVSTVDWIEHVNLTRSEFGAGWNIAGLDRIHFSGDRSTALWVRGDGGVAQMKRASDILAQAKQVPCPFSEITAVTNADDGAVLIAYARGIAMRARDGTYTTLLDGVEGGLWTSYDNGVTGVAQAETGTIYFTLGCYTYPDPARRLSSGLYRLRPGTATPELVTEASYPHGLAMDGDGFCYLYDEVDSLARLCRVDDAGRIEVLSYGFGHQIVFDKRSNLLIETGWDACIVRQPNGTDDVVIDLAPMRAYFRSPVFMTPDGVLCAAFTGGTLPDGSPRSDDYWGSWDVRGNFLGDLGVVHPRVALTLDGYASHLVVTPLRDVVVASRDSMLVAENSFDGTAEACYAIKGGDCFDLRRMGTEWVATGADGSIVSFDDAGRLAFKTDRFGNALTYSYGLEGRLVAVEMTGGAGFTFAYDGGGHLRSVTDTSGRTTSFVIDPNGNLTRVVLPDGSARAFTYDVNHCMVSKADPRGNVTGFTVSQQATYTEITYPNGTKSTFAIGRVQAAQASDSVPGVDRTFETSALPAIVMAEDSDKVADPSGNVSLWTTNDRGALLKQMKTAGESIRRELDGLGRVIRASDGNGRDSSVAYGSNGKVSDSLLADGSALSFVYDLRFQQVSGITLPDGSSIAFAYDDDGNLITKTLPDGTAYHYSYNTSGQLLSSADPLSRTTQLEYDSLGNLVGMENPSRGRSSLVRDSAGRILSATDAGGRSVSTTYDAMNRVQSVTDAAGNTTSISYDANGNRIRVTDALGRVTRFEYDNMDNLVKMVAPDGSASTYTYVGGFDGEQLVSSVTDPNGNTRRLTYDGANRVTSMADEFGQVTRFTYDGNGNRLSMTDPKGRITWYSYDEMNRPISSTAPDGGVTVCGYDVMGNLVSITDPKGNKTTRTYDSLNRLLTETDPAGKVRSFTYDSAGQLVSETNRRGQVITYGYDALGRRTSVSYGSETITFTYSATGELLTATNSQGTVTRTYDVVGRMTEEQQIPGRITYTYDAVGNRTSMTDAIGTTTYGYDQLQRLTALTDPSMRAFDFVYDTGSRLTGVGYPNGVTAVSSYDTADRLLSIKHLLGEVEIAGASYTYDAADNRTSETREDALTRTFGYDLNDRLASATSNAPAEVASEAFAYDKTGNWTINGREHDATNALTDDSFYAYKYDADGNLIERRSRMGEVTTYAWDALNRLYFVQTPTVEVRIAYDPMGRRLEKTETQLAGGATQTVRYLYDGANVRLELNGGGAVLAANTCAGLDRMLERDDYQTGATHYLHADGLGSTIALTGSTGEVTERYRYSAYGRLSVLSADFTPLASAPQVAYTYTGRDWDSALGLYHNRARYYSPDMGRFISRDPIGFAGGINVFAYTGNNPISFFDVTGFERGASNQGAKRPYTPPALQSVPTWWNPFTWSMNDWVDASIAAQKGAAGYINALTFGANGTGGFDPSDSAFQTGRSIGVAARNVELVLGGMQAFSIAGATPYFFSGAGAGAQAASAGYIVTDTAGGMIAGGAQGALNALFGARLGGTLGYYGIWYGTSAAYAITSGLTNGVVGYVGNRNGQIWTQVEEPILNLLGVTVCRVP